MQCPQEKQPVVVVSAVMRADGLPAFALNQAEVTAEERDNGIHYYLVEADLLQAGYEEPFVHFDEGEAPSFLHPAVRQHLSRSPAEPQPCLVAPTEECSCPASSK